MKWAWCLFDTFQVVAAIIIIIVVVVVIVVLFSYNFKIFFLFVQWFTAAFRLCIIINYTLHADVEKKLNEIKCDSNFSSKIV